MKKVNRLSTLDEAAMEAVVGGGAEEVVRSGVVDRGLKRERFRREMKYVAR